ncbi:MerR family DNA-binding transcriptional regulator, partial [Paraburkholderia hospita]
MRLLSIGETATLLGVAVGTLRRWHRQRRLAPHGRTLGGHRRYLHDSVCASSKHAPPSSGKTICYARVSSYDQAGQLDTQASRLQRHCVDAGFADIEIVSYREYQAKS